MTLRELLEYFEKGERFSDGYTEYTLHESVLDQEVGVLMYDADEECQ